MLDESVPPGNLRKICRSADGFQYIPLISDRVMQAPNRVAAETLLPWPNCGNLQAACWPEKMCQRRYQ